MKEASIRSISSVRWKVNRADLLALLIMAVVILGFTHEYWNPLQPGIPTGIDLGDNLAYLVERCLRRHASDWPPYHSIFLCTVDVAFIGLWYRGRSAHRLYI